LWIDMDDVQEHDPDLAEAMAENTRRYINIFGEIIQEMLPDYREREVKKHCHISRHYVQDHRSIKLEKRKKQD